IHAEKSGFNPLIFQAGIVRLLPSNIRSQRIMECEIPEKRNPLFGQPSQNTNRIATGKESATINHLHLAPTSHESSVLAVLDYPPVLFVTFKHTMRTSTNQSLWIRKESDIVILLKPANSHAVFGQRHTK